jgi:hypothetical protein
LPEPPPPARGRGRHRSRQLAAERAATDAIASLSAAAVGRQASATPVGRAGQLAEQLGGELTTATGGAAPASRLLLRFPPAALPDEVWPDRSPFPATDTAVEVNYS